MDIGGKMVKAELRPAAKVRAIYEDIVQTPQLIESPLQHLHPDRNFADLPA
jgi:hypothetical protein